MALYVKAPVSIPTGLSTQAHAPLSHQRQGRLFRLDASVRLSRVRISVRDWQRGLRGIEIVDQFPVWCNLGVNKSHATIPAIDNPSRAGISLHGGQVRYPW